MDRVLRFARIAEETKALFHDLLEIRLTNVDHIERTARAAELRRIGGALAARRFPQDMAVGIGPELFVAERSIEQSELPELIRDVLAGVGDRAVRADQDLVRLVHPLELRASFELHHPAAFVLSLCFKHHSVGALQHLEGALPEMEGDDVAFFRQEVVFDVQPQQRLNVPLHDSPGDESREFRRVSFSTLDAMQRVEAPLLRLRMLRVIGCHPGVKIPAEVIKANLRIVDPLLDLCHAFLLQVLEGHDDIGDLHARVIDVVLRLHVMSQPLQAADQSVAEDRVANVADVGRFVRIDVGVLDDHPLGARWRRCFAKRSVSNRPRRTRRPLMG